MTLELVSWYILFCHIQDRLLLRRPPGKHRFLGGGWWWKCAQLLPPSVVTLKYAIVKKRLDGFKSRDRGWHSLMAGMNISLGTFLPCGRVGP